MGPYMMETEVLKTILACQGAASSEYLLSNLGFDQSSQIIGNREKFVFCCPYGQPKVVVRTNLRLCRAKACPGSCKGLHLCKTFLFRGSCRFSQTGRGCIYSHELDSLYNQTVLADHDLESLSRTELCTLLMQSDSTLLPAVCFDYNNGPGEYGKCKDGVGCKRLHICEKSLHQDCSCYRTHDFMAPQPLKTLQDRGVPESLFACLRSVYANKEALWHAGIRGDGNSKGNIQKGPPYSAGHDLAAAAFDIDASSNDGQNAPQREWIRGRGRGGFRGNRGNRGNRSNRGNRGTRGTRGGQGNRPLQERSSSNESLTDIDNLDLYTDGGLTSDHFQQGAGHLHKTSAAVKGRGSNRGNWNNRQELKQTRSTSDIFGAAGANADGDGGPNRRPKPRPPMDKTEICLYFIKGHCKHGDDRCFRVHEKLPYRWEVNRDGEWTVLADNETIERDYCDPNNTYSSSSPPVHFDTMTQGQNKVRRLSTINSLLQPDFILTTEWLWYWEDEFGKWTLYASASGGHRAADMDSSKLEQKFLENDRAVVEFSAGSQSYSLSFTDMIQTNKHYSTKRLVKRRPRFVSAADVLAKRVRKPVGRAISTAVPDHWDKSQIPQTGYKAVSLLRTSDEYKEIEALFCQTMRGFDIIKIERIQNKALWEVFQWQKQQMKNKNNGHNVTEKKLFHGTNSKFTDVISCTNFDWRICGTHGTVYGQGSYFARDAKYSHDYTGDSVVRSMFVALVLVGDFTKGSSNYRRPPSKDGGDINFYDSCVDDVMTPSIFVVFEKHQIYPEYLLQYKTQHPLVSVYGGASAPAPKTVAPAATVPVPTPVPAPKPVPALKPVATSTPVLAPKPVPTPKPAAAPRAAFAQPTLSYESKTDTYQFRRNGNPFSQSSPAASPTLKAKKQSDSCIIA